MSGLKISFPDALPVSRQVFVPVLYLSFSVKQMNRLYEINESTLTGRLKNSVLIGISGSSETVPSDRQIWAKIMSEWRNNPEAGRLFFYLLNTPPVRAVDFQAEISEAVTKQLLSYLAEIPPVETILAEGVFELEDTLGEFFCLILGHLQPGGKSGYYVYLVEVNSFCSHGCMFFSIVPGETPELLEISTLGEEGWRALTLKAALDSAPIRAILNVFRSKITDGIPRQVPPQNLRWDRNSPEPPIDNRLVELLAKAYKNKIQVSHVLVDSEKIKPGNVAYLSSISGNNPLKGSLLPRLTAYWDGDKFISSDDYHALHQYFSNDVKEIPLAVVGKFPKSACKEVLRRGRSALIPPLLMVPCSSSLSEDDEFWLLKKTLKKGKSRVLQADDLATWLVFSDLISKKNALEREYHDFIRDHPVILSQYGDQLLSEVSLSGEYFIDLVAFQSGRMPQLFLIELERSNHTVITQGKQEGASVTHAVQQVSDWLRWWRNNRDHELVSPYRGIDPKGLVVIGRSRDLTDAQVEILSHNNQRRDIEVITYDQLLDKFGQSLLARMDDEVG